VTFEGSDASPILVALVEVGCVEQPGLDGLVVGGGEDEVPGHKNPLENNFINILNQHSKMGS